MLDTKSQALKYCSLQTPDKSYINIKIQSIKNYLEENITEYLSQFWREINLQRLKMEGYHQEQDGCAEIHKAKNFGTIKINQINIRGKATEKGNIFEYHQKNLVSKI